MAGNEGIGESDTDLLATNVETVAGDCDEVDTTVDVAVDVVLVTGVALKGVAENV